MLYDSGSLTGALAEGEGRFARKHPCILDRIALDIISTIAAYTLPTYTLSIKRVTWKGMKLYPLPERLKREVFQGGSLTNQGKPFYYTFNQIPQFTIRLFPIPNETIAANQTNLYGSNIKSQVIVEFWRTSDNNIKIIPAFFRRRLLKTYALSKVFASEGRGQNLKAVAYYSKKYDDLEKVYSNLLSEIHNKPRRLIVSGEFVHPNRMYSAILPVAKFGIGLDEGE
jgi:hypothetical protein